MTAQKKSIIYEFTCMVILAVTLVFILNTLSFVFIPFFIALLLCYAFGMPLEYLQKKHVPPVIRILLTIFLIVGSCYMLGRVIQMNLVDLKDALPELEVKFWEYADILLAKAEITRQQAEEAVRGFAQSLGKEELRPIGVAIQWLSESFFSLLGNLFWVLLFVAFIIAERGGLSRKIVAGFGPEKAISILDAMERINKSVQQYLGLKTAVSLLTGLLVTIVLALLDVPFPVLWGVVAFVLNFIPNIGSIIAGIPPVMLTLFASGSIVKTLIVAVAFAAIQMLAGNIIEPKVMGDGLDLSPLMVLLALLFWGWLWGIPGMLLSVPLTAAAKIAMEQIDQTRPVAILMGSGARIK